MTELHCFTKADIDQGMPIIRTASIKVDKSYTKLYLLATHPFLPSDPISTPSSKAFVATTPKSSPLNICLSIFRRSCGIYPPRYDMMRLSISVFCFFSKFSRSCFINNSQVFLIYTCKKVVGKFWNEHSVRYQPCRMQWFLHYLTLDTRIFPRLRRLHLADQLAGPLGSREAGSIQWISVVPLYCSINGQVTPDETSLTFLPHGAPSWFTTCTLSTPNTSLICFKSMQS